MTAGSLSTGRADVFPADLAGGAAELRLRPADRVVRALHPEYRAGGYLHNDERVVFFLRVNWLLRSTDRVLDFGAGRAAWWQNERDSLPGRLRDLRSRCAEVVGFDVDRAVAANPTLHRAVHAPPGAPLPFADASFDLIVAYAVLEHIDDPTFYAAELDRVLRPGGWLCAWTPNRWGFVALGARLVPTGLQNRILRRLRPEAEEQDIFPKFYRMNTRRALRSLFPGYLDATYVFSGHPCYHGGSILLARALRLYNAIVPEVLGQNLHVFLRKPAADRC